MAYQVLARSWRPQRFESVIGQDPVVTTLRNALTAGTLGHAYLFSGLRGVGKTTAARLLAKAVNCERGPNPEPCGECVPCREIADGSNLDVVELDGASNRGIDDVRELRELLRYRPARDRYRVIIIDEVHMLTREAFNALLKSLEEPPPYILFVLATTERHKVPATILSRCQQLEFRPVPSPLIASRLGEIAKAEGVILSAGAAAAIARAAQGSVRDALSLLDQLRAFAEDAIDEDAIAAVLGVPRSETVAELIGDLCQGRPAEALSTIRRELAAGRDATVLYHEAGRAFRAMLATLLEEAPGTEGTEEPDHSLATLAAELGPDALTRMLGLWLEHERLIRDTSNPELALEVAALRLTRWPTIRRIERALAGGGEIEGPGGGDPTPSAPQPQGPTPHSAKGLLERALWESGQRQLAGAIDQAEIELRDHTLRVSFPSSAAALGGFVTTGDNLQTLERTARGLFAQIKTVAVEGGGAPTSDELLCTEALGDPDLQLVREIIGGTIVQVRPDHEVEEVP
jgi:DNA polymerase-3 subunit gamma/tau